MLRQEKATSLYRNGLNCAQSVIGAFEDIIGEEKATMTSAATGFGGGMGKLQKTCGAITGSIMVMSKLQNNNTQDSQKLLTQNIQNYLEKFEKHFGSVDCRNLIPYNLNSNEGKEKAIQHNVFEEKCTKFITKSVEWVSNILDIPETNGL